MEAVLRSLLSPTVVRLETKHAARQEIWSQSFLKRQEEMESQDMINSVCYCVLGRLKPRP